MLKLEKFVYLNFNKFFKGCNNSNSFSLFLTIELKNGR